MDGKPPPCPRIGLGDQRRNPAATDGYVKPLCQPTGRDHKDYPKLARARERIVEKTRNPDRSLTGLDVAACRVGNRIAVGAGLLWAY